MKKDASYYENRIRKKTKKQFDELTAGLSDEEFLKIPDDVLEETYAETTLHRIRVCLDEADAMISALVNDTADLNGKYSVSVTRPVPHLRKRMLVTEFYTREEIIKRLERIANEDFGDDLDEWQSWISAFKASPPMGTR
ncbi:hypothetical protein [Thalassospira sp. TSL5-1]|uniref:hypothetical protein n=1 Tax=Thalassospira sp. TSL5-1 TaxID=1544451 RepID=UPI00093C1739|nr:hypothetical protein [Thalassospira sp. TSL5-1]OKH87851.1 hypothetical protein LF95_14105 [Thalassospira sp. TSL5-1]